MKTLFSIFCIILFIFPVYAIDNNAPEGPVEEYSENDFELLKSERLLRIRSELVAIRHKINIIQKKITEDLDMLARIQFEAKIKKLETDYDNKRNLFIEIITDINLKTDLDKQNTTNFSDDIKQILDPVLNIFKKISEKPRKMQALKERLSLLQEQYTRSQKAHEKLKDFLQTLDKKTLKWKVKESIKLTKSLNKKLKVELEDLRFKILKMENSKESIVSTFSSLIFEFIKTKGKNLFLALMVFVMFFWIFKTGQTKFINLVLFKVSRSENQELYSWIIRPTKVVYNVATTLMAFLLSILTLYVLNDWVLVTFVLIVLAAIFWSSKQYMPLFLEQSKIVLNLGSVREGERVIYKGLPWKIQSLGYYCKLENPALSAAGLRVNTKELVNLHSRRSDDDEPWFPTQVNDWAQVDGEFGKIILQSPQQVILENIAGEEVYFESKELYALGPKNLSKGFAIEFIFGIDYSLQVDLFDKIIPNFEKEIQKVLYQKHPQLKGNILELQIEFNNANSSSLDLRFFMKCKGAMAADKLKLERSMQAEFVKICNKYHYLIPFNQLVLHTQDNINPI